VVSSGRRIGWIAQLRVDKDDWEPVQHYDIADHVERWFDRFSCRWQGPSSRVRFGPACADLTEAIAWSEFHCHHAFVDAFGDRWSTGAAREGFATLPPMADWVAGEAERWVDVASERWVVGVALRLGPRDYLDAAPIFERSLRTLADVDRCLLDPVGARLSAQMQVFAPTLDLAREIARHLARQAATDLPDGLRDETNEVFDATVMGLDDTPGHW